MPSFILQSSRKYGIGDMFIGKTGSATESAVFMLYLSLIR